ncbi:MAG: paraquat-inducible protein A, partial [Kangiellaceae bacterium]|nr:paraquat-inducible protein A [Kangiellaceae bacterium]
EGHKALCPRCNHVLTQKRRNARDKVFAFAISAIIFLVFSLPFDFLSFESKGNARIVTLAESIESLSLYNFESIAILIFLTTILVPGIFLLGLVYVLISLSVNKMYRHTQKIAKFLFSLLQWNMAEIFLIGILVSFVKIASMAKVNFGLSFFAYVLFIIFLALTVSNLDRFQFWRWVKIHIDQNQPNLSQLKDRGV